MQTIQIEVGPHIKVNVQAPDIKELIRLASFWSSLPRECPLCGAGLVLFHRTPSGNLYLGQKCLGPKTHESNFGIHKDANAGLYYKGEWKEAFTGGQYQEEMSYTGQAQAAPPAQYQQSPPAQYQQAPPVQQQVAPVQNPAVPAPTPAVTAPVAPYVDDDIPF